MRIDKPDHQDLYHVTSHMRDRDVEELSAIYPVDGRTDVAWRFRQLYEGRPDLICGYDDDRVPFCIGAPIETRPNVITLGFIATDTFPRHARLLGRWIRGQLFAGMKKAGCHRIETVSIAGYDETHRWLRLLGLRQEATHSGFGKRGETFHTFAWVDDAYKTGNTLR